MGIWLCSTPLLAQTNETYPSLTVGPDVYTNVVILNKTRSDVFIKHRHGMANIKVADLDPGEVASGSHAVAVVIPAVP